MVGRIRFALERFASPRHRSHVAQLFSLGVMTLPAPYVGYFASDAPKEGALAVEPGWFQLWQPAEVEQLNRDYHVPEFAPGFLGFGSKVSGELFSLQFRRSRCRT